MPVDVLARAIFFAYLAATLLFYLLIAGAAAGAVVRWSRQTMGHHLADRRTPERVTAA